MSRLNEDKTIKIISNIEANKGEWCEFYTNIKIMSDGYVIKADSNLNPDESTIYPVIAVLNKDKNDEVLRYEIQEKRQSILLKKIDGSILATFSTKDISVKAKQIFQKIIDGTKTFKIPEATCLAKELGIISLKEWNNKADIKLEINNPYLGKIIEEGYSIKSKLDAESTLVNASKQTRFTYTVKELPVSIISSINEISGSGKVIKRVLGIVENKGRFEFKNIESEVFTKNIKKVDSLLDQILAKMLLFTYTHHCKKLKEIIEHKDFLRFLATLDLDKDSCIYKVKRFLWAYALGMEPSTPWEGEDFVNGGLLWVKSDGSILCHHIFERKELESYLFNNTFFETASTSRHEFAKLVAEGDDTLFRLCLQIRFY